MHQDLLWNKAFFGVHTAAGFPPYVHPDPLWMRVFLLVHIAAGFTAFLLAPVALVTAKGGKQHRRWGMVYLWAMGVVAGTALPMALWRPVLFLALVAIFSFYAAFSGWRITKLKSLARGGSAQAVDWIAGVFTFCASACLAGFGAFRPALVQHMGIVAIVFGFLGMRLAAAEMLKFVRKPKDKMFWWYTHLGNFIGSYIAAWTAFLVTNIHPHSVGLGGRFGCCLLLWGCRRLWGRLLTTSGSSSRRVQAGMWLGRSLRLSR